MILIILFILLHAGRCSILFPQPATENKATQKNTVTMLLPPHSRLVPEPYKPVMDVSTRISLDEKYLGTTKTITYQSSDNFRLSDGILRKEISEITRQKGYPGVH